MLMAFKSYLKLWQKKGFHRTGLTVFTIRISICPLPSVGGGGKGFGHDPAGTQIQCDGVTM